MSSISVAGFIREVGARGSLRPADNRVPNQSRNYKHSCLSIFQLLRVTHHVKPSLAPSEKNVKEGTMPRVSEFLRDDSGQGLVEYALIIALVSVVAIAALQYLGAKASNTLNAAANTLSN